MNRILLVNDDMETVNRTATMLEALKWDVYLANTDENVFETCVAHRPSLVIIDLEMKGGIGFDCIGTVRRLFPDLFIIAVAPRVSDKLWPAAAAICGANRVIEGPLSSSLQSLSEAIDSGIAEGLVDRQATTERATFG